MRNLSGLLFGLIGTVIRILEEWSVAEVTIKRRRCASTSSSSSSSSSGDDVVSLDSDVEGGGGGVVVAEGTLRRLDHIKKEKPLARGALRWIHSHISGENGRFRIGQARQPMKCAEQLAARMPTACTVIATVLTMSDVVEEPTNKGMEKFKDSDER
ncbi:unnamed protein product [Gongylonema pulchrum]|uniref:Secreted protein n=1 Tax=Gongylonema pulchrum TaxID=637853 RepID=A0A183ECY4_9BILA|nr:unnamed protein product [Gongylonema pulchrum]